MKKISKLLIFGIFSIFSSTQASNEMTINLAIRDTIINTDPQTMEDVSSLFINRQIHRGLMKYSSDLELLNDLISNYEVKDNGKTYIFTLSKSFFSDGSKITSKDVVKTFKRMKFLKSAIVTDLHSIIGLSSKSKEELGIIALSDTEIQFKLKFADPFFLKNLAAVDCSILKIDDNLNLLSHTSGKFIISNSESKIILTLRDEFSKNKFTINIFKVKTEAEALDLARNGKIDSLETFIVNSETSQFLEKKNWITHETQIAKVVFLTLNPKKLDFNERKIIYSKITKFQGNGFINGLSSAYGLIPPVIAGSLNIKDIQSLIKDRNVTPNEQNLLTIMYPNGDEFSVIANWLKKNLDTHGYKVILKPFAIKDYFKHVKDAKFEIIMRSKYLDYPDGMSVLTYFKTKTPINLFFAGDSTSDKLISKAQLETNLSKRIEIYKKIQLQLLKNYTIVPLAAGSTLNYMTSSKIKKIKAHPLGLHSLYLDEIEVGN